MFKIGITSKNSIENRYGKSDMKLIKNILFYTTFLDGGEAWDLEQQVLKLYGKNKYKGKKIFKHTSITEMFNKNPLTIIQQIIKENYGKENPDCS